MGHLGSRLSRRHGHLGCRRRHGNRGCGFAPKLLGTTVLPFLLQPIGSCSQDRQRHQTCGHGSGVGPPWRVGWHGLGSLTRQNHQIVDHLGWRFWRWGHIIAADHRIRIGPQKRGHFSGSVFTDGRAVKKRGPARLQLLDLADGQIGSPGEVRDIPVLRKPPFTQQLTPDTIGSWIGHP